MITRCSNDPDLADLIDQAITVPLADDDHPLQ